MKCNRSLTHTLKGNIFKREKKKKEKKEKRKLFFQGELLRGQVFFGKYYRLRWRFLKKPEGLGLAAEKAIHPYLAFLFYFIFEEIFTCKIPIEVYPNSWG
jgi:hypothetical protein